MRQRTNFDTFSEPETENQEIVTLAESISCGSIMSKMTPIIPIFIFFKERGDGIRKGFPGYD
jgi:hypothetical protein